MTEHDDQAEARRADAIDQALLTIDLVRESWGWLVDLVEPGRASAAGPPPVTDDQLERLEALGYSDRAYRDWNLRHGMSALPPSPAPARLAVVDAQAAAAHHVDTAVRIAAGAIDASYVGGRPSLAESVAAALGWLEDVVGELHAAAAAGVDRVLQRADRVARAAAREDDEAMPVQGRCPACGLRSLRSDRGAIRCVREACVCTGPGGPESEACACGRADSVEGTRHAWAGADRDALWAAIEAQADARPRVARGAAGHGGWQSRDMGRPVIVAGVLWWSTAEALAQLQVDRKRLNDWVRRSREAGHRPGADPVDCRACGRPGFPHVDPPVRRGGVSGYKAEQLLRAEGHTAASRVGVSRDA